MKALAAANFGGGRWLLAEPALLCPDLVALLLDLLCPELATAVLALPLALQQVAAPFSTVFHCFPFLSFWGFFQFEKKKNRDRETEQERNRERKRESSVREKTREWDEKGSEEGGCDCRGEFLQKTDKLRDASRVDRKAILMIDRAEDIDCVLRRSSLVNHFWCWPWDR
ncbi:uncharacterized protein LOC116209129 [Punica granatum]|uniref:Uncharacterized protein LOC116209129 n=1 Tax=Punica granatum TaxID=22663 RepID=A0A6P8DRC2_PUNGR|nr:uncharacterized protein LOC116209129 [Punica granatum]